MILMKVCVSTSILISLINLFSLPTYSDDGCQMMIPTVCHRATGIGLFQSAGLDQFLCFHLFLLVGRVSFYFYRGKLVEISNFYLSSF